MARRYSRKRDNGLIAIALRSDWRVSAALAAGSLFVGIVLVPVFLGSSAMLRPLAGVFTPLAWLFALIFAAIAFISYLKSGFAASAVGSSRRGAGRNLPSDRHPAPDDSRSEAAAAMTVFAPAPPMPPKAPAIPPPENWSLDVLDRIEWKRFEDLCCAFYREKGIRAETTPLGADGGIDIHLFQDQADPNRATSIVQCKAWNKPVGVKEVRELRGVVAHQKVEKAFFMAPNGYTDDARAFATENRITLLDGKLFLAMLQRLPTEASKRLLAFATEGEWTTPTCPSCGMKMNARSSKRGPFWGCPDYPRCKGKLQMRGAVRA